MDPLLHLELTRIRVADDHRFARSWLPGRRRLRPAAPASPVGALPARHEVRAPICA